MSVLEGLIEFNRVLSYNALGIFDIYDCFYISFITQGY
jgi:hypothetical protein